MQKTRKNMLSKELAKLNEKAMHKVH